MSTVRFDLPYALVTLNVTDTSGVEIEVWPKQGQSAFVVLPPDVARHVAAAIGRLADEAEAADAVADEEEPVASEDSAPDEVPSNVYDLTSRRLARDRGES